MLVKVGLLFNAVLALSVITAAKRDVDVNCYFGSWTGYRTGLGTYNTSFIDPFLCTQLNYAFMGISAEGEITILDPYNDLEDDYGKGTIKKFNELKKINPALKTYAAVGGWNAGSTNFSIVAANPVLCKKFAVSSVNFLKKYGFDGMNMDWEYPMQRNDLNNNDRDNFNTLLKIIKNEFKPYGFKLTIAVAATKTSATLSYNIAGLVKLVDQVIIMAYDLHIGTEPLAAFNAPVYPAKRETTELQRELNLDSILKFWLSQFPAKKLLLGAAFYGHSFTLADPTNTAPGAPSKGPGPAGPFTQEPGTISYNELCIQWQTEKWTQKFDEEQQVPYAYKDGIWVSYENSKSMYLKGQLAKKYKLGGVSTWSLDNDDFHGLCSGRKNTLLYALNQGVNSKQAQILNCQDKKQ